MKRDLIITNKYSEYGSNLSSYSFIYLIIVKIFKNFK
jgi:hypothetical protein